MGQIAGVVTIKAKEGSEEAVAALLQRMHAAAIEDDGCDFYSVVRVDTDPGTFVLLELYRDKAALKLHRANAALAELGPQLAPLTETVDIRLGTVVVGDTGGRV